MTHTELGFHPAVVDETAAAAAWYRERSPLAEEAFLAEIDRAVELIAETPERWPPHLHGTHRFLLHRFPYSVVFRHDNETILASAVAHARRRPGYWRHR